MEYGESSRENRHSRMGIASFVLGILAFVVMVVLFVVFGVLLSSVLEGVDPQNIDPQSLQDSPGAIGLGLVTIGIVGTLLMYLVGLALGIAGIFQRRRKRLFAVLGAVGNGIVLLVFVVFAALIGVSGGV